MGFQKGHPVYLKNHTEETKEKIRLAALADGRKPDFTGRKHTPESKEKMRLAKLGVPYKSKRKRPPVTEEYRKKVSEIMKKKVAEGKHNFYIDGRTPENTKIRRSVEMKLWREAVFKRDNWTCVIGGKEHGSKLNADHIKPFCDYPELRFDVNNGRTLCVECHKKTDTYGGRRKKTNGAPVPSQMGTMK